ncbi:cilia- and flagella-associated protein 43 isoform X5 [Mastacembelus armatus]|nr:cilia- and flagella-associated protein 43 isoform X5 [Mastacembelus armatus]
MREHEVRLEVEQVRLERELSQLDSKQEETRSEGGYSWYFWSTVSFIIFFIIEMCRMDVSETDIRPAEDEDIFSESGSITVKTMVLDKDILRNFCDKCTYTSAHENGKVREFVEGLADDLLESLRSVCDREADMEVGDFVGIGSMFEFWKVCKPLMCDLLVPFSPPEPYSFHFHLWCSSSSDIPPDMQGCGKIKVTKLGENEDCLCDSANLGTAQLDYTSLTLSHGGPYLGCCSSFPDHTITVWNWENAEPICKQPQAGKDVISLVFNPLNWLQLCALDTTSLTVWNIEKSADHHVLKSSVIELPATDGSFVEKLVHTSHSVSDELPYFGPEMPPSAISGLKGDKAESIVAKLCSKARLTPTAICWTATSELYVGCAQGFLLLVDPESLSVSVLFNPTTTDAIPELRQSKFQGLTLSKNGLITIEKGSVVHCLQIKGTQINIAKTWKLEAPVTTVKFSPDYESLLLASNSGQIYLLSSTQSDKIRKVLDLLSGNFVAAAFLHTNKNICLLRSSGELQLCSRDGICLGSLYLQAEVSSLACCPIAQYAAVGTTSGSVLFIDLNREQQPRLVHQVHLYHIPVDHLVFDQEGQYLLTGGSDTHIFVLDAKPSERFSVIGYTVVPGFVLSLSTQCVRDSGKVKVLALCTGKEGKSHDGSLLTLLTLPARYLAGPDGVDRNGCLSTDIFKVSTYEVSHPLKSCVLGVDDVFAYCHRRKTLQRFQLPQDTDGHSSQQVVQLKAEQEVKGHPLGPASLILSPHQLWLASVGRDGLLRIRETASMERYIELQCHSCRLGGIRSVSFSADSQTLLTAGFQDGSLVCTNLRIKCKDRGKDDKATWYSQFMANSLKNIFNTENPVLIGFPDWGQEPPAGTEKSRDIVVSNEMETLNVTEHNNSYNSLLFTPPSHHTWLESRREMIIKEENEQYSETKKNLRKTIKELSDTIQEMMHENENLPDIEHLEQHEFNLDIEEQKRLEAMVGQEVTKVRNEIEWDIIAKYYLHDVLKRECWDSMKFKGRTLKAFHSKHEVKNYPLKERTEKEVEDLHRVQNMRKLEKAACHVSKTKGLDSESSQKKSSNTASGSEEEQGEEDHKEKSAAVVGSFSAQLGYLNPYIYDQFSLLTTEQRINQIILLQGVIYRIRMAFNTEFEAVHRQKVQELNRVRDRNRKIREIMMELDMNEKLWEPSLTDSEWPERLLTVDDSEIKAEKYFTPEQKKEEQMKKLEEQRRLAAKDDDYRERGLSDMMDGVLEVKKDDILKMEIPPPEFVLTKPEVQWSEEEKNVYKEFEKKTKSLSEEKEKYKKLLETEMKKLMASTRDATEKFDETLTKLFEKVKCEMAIYQEELKITYLVYSVLIEEEMRNRELELKLKLEKTLAYKDEIEEEVKRHEEELELFQETYDSVVAENKVLDKDFRKEFLDVPAHVVDHLYKLYKRRPRVQKIRTQTDNPNPFKDQSLCGSLAPDALGKMLKAMEELDAPENMPEGLNPSIWERFCLVRRTKVECEQKVKVSALTLAEMQAFLLKRRNENKVAQEEIKNLTDELERHDGDVIDSHKLMFATVLHKSVCFPLIFGHKRSQITENSKSLHKEKNRFQKDIMVQVLLKQGQVEVSATDLTADYTDSVLQNRSVVEDLNSTIRMFGAQKIALMVKCKNVHKGICKLEWEHKMMRMQIEDLNNKARSIQEVQLSEEQQDYLHNTDRDSSVSKQVSILEKTIGFQEKTHLRSVQHRIKKIEQLNRQATMKADNAILEQQLSNMQMAVAERKRIYEAIASVENQTANREERYQKIVEKKKLEDTARAQAENLAFLWRELDRLMKKNFPSLDQLKHKT